MLLIVSSLLGGLLLSAFLFYQVVLVRIRANVVIEPFSKENSYIFLTPLRAKADGLEKIRLTVFVLNNQGLGVPAKNITWGDAADLQGSIVQNPTDDLGKAVIDFTSTKVQQVSLQIRVENEELPQQVKLNFY